MAITKNITKNNTEIMIKWSNFIIALCVFGFICFAGKVLSLHAESGDFSCHKISPKFQRFLLLKYFYLASCRERIDISFLDRFFHDCPDG